MSPSSLEGSVLTGYWIAYPTGLGACFDYDFLKNLNDLQENLQVQISGLPFCPLTNSRVLAVQVGSQFRIGVTTFLIDFEAAEKLV